jgi:50S ribosomal protein L16 3-hydroxylase
VPDAPLRVLRSFRPQREWVLETGDVLYLPPHYGHDGVAVTDCITVSIGFRAPAARELAAGFLEFMQDRLRLDGMYRDPDLRQQRRPAAIGARMIGKAEAVLERIDWGRRDVVRFLGSYLTEPKARVVFARPARALGERAFARAIGRHGVRLALATRMLFHRGTIFINGESREPGAPAVRLLSRAADRRMLPPLPRIDRESARILYQWYRAGYIEVNDRA